MQKSIRIRVLSFTAGKETEYYRNTLFTDGSLSVDLAKIHDVLLLLYPSASVIEFEISR